MLVHEVSSTTKRSSLHPWRGDKVVGAVTTQDTQSEIASMQKFPHTRDVESCMASRFIPPWRIISGRKSQLGTNLH